MCNNNNSPRAFAGRGLVPGVDEASHLGKHDADDVGGDAGDDDGEDNDDDDDDTSISPKGTALVATPNLPRPGSHLKSIASENAGNRGLTLGRFGRSRVSSSFKLLAPALSSDGTWFGNSQWMTFIFIIHEKSS